MRYIKFNRLLVRFYHIGALFSRVIYLKGVEASEKWLLHICKKLYSSKDW